MSLTVPQFEIATILSKPTCPPTISTISFQPLKKFFRPSAKTPSKQTLMSYSGSTHGEATSSEYDLQDEVKQEKILKFITTWRRASLDDIPTIEQLENTAGHYSRVLYKKHNFDELIARNYFSIVQLNARDEVVAFTSCNHYPDIVSLSATWREWLETHYRIKNVGERSALFIHYMIWEPQRENEFLQHFLEISFTEFVHLKQIFVIKPPKVRIPNCYKQYFVPVFPYGMENCEPDSVQTLYTCLRATIIPPLTVRSAFHRDLERAKNAIARMRTPLTKEQKDLTSDLKQVSEFLEREDKKTIVCEKNNELVGILVLSLTVDLEALNKEFELIPFNGLRKKDPRAGNNIDPWLPSRISSLKKGDRNNIYLSSEFFFDQINWEVSSDNSSDRESTRDTLISHSFSLDTNFWHFSCMQSLSNAQVTGSSSNLTNSVRYKSSSPSTKEYRAPFQSSFCKMTHFLSSMCDGSLNCFAIDFLLADTRRVDEKLVSLDLLRAAFEIAGDKDYCLLIIPSQFLPDRLQEFFIRVTPKLPSSTTLQLYLCHRDTLPETDIFVKSAEDTDLFSLYNFLKRVEDGEAIYEDITRIFFEEGNLYKIHLLFAEEQIIGVSVLDSRDYHNSFNDCYDIARHVPEVNIFEEKLLLKHLIVEPSYHCHTRFFMQQIMRLCDINCLYYAFNFPEQDYYSLVTVLEEFSPIAPRKMAPFDTSFVFTKEPNETCPSPFSLYFLTENSCSYNRIHVNIFIVVVGASRTALSFMENLLFGPASVHVQYNNLICVTPHALESVSTQGSEIIDLMFPIRDELSRSYSYKLALKTYVSFVYGIMTAINRSEKYITVNNKTVIKYDYLILTCGAQYFIPTITARETKKKACQRRHPSPLARFLVSGQEKDADRYKKPSNMFLINSTWDAKSAFRALQNLINKSKKGDKKIIVYGHNIHVFLTIHTLMKLGIPGEVIVFVEPFSPDNGEVTVFNDYSVDQAVLESLKKSKVNYYTRYFLYDWIIEDDRITSVIFHSRTKQLEVPCLAFFPFDQKFVSIATQRACLESGLIYDGKLIINHNFKTNDEYIYAAGPFTKYARKYFANDKDHQFYNSREVGIKLAQIIRCKVDPFMDGTLEDESMLVPQLKEPLMYYCQLPGNFNFFVMRKPGKEVDLETAYNLKDYGDVLYTGDCEMKNGFGYFRLHLSPEGFVESITCYTKDNIDYLNLTSLYGLHETLLNNLLCRYDLSLIPNFFEYFRQPWARAIFHEDFKYLRQQNLKALKKKLKDGSSINDKATEIVKMNDWRPLPSDTIHLLQTQFENSSAKKEIENNLLEFLRNFYDELPGFASIKSGYYRESKANDL